MEACLPFSLLGLDSDNGGEFLNHHVLKWLQKRPRPVFMTRSRPYKKDDNAHVEQKNWTHVRQCFGYERHDNPEVVDPINALVKGAYGQLLNYFHASLKLERKERKEGRVRRIYGKAQTPLARVLASPQVTAQTKQRLQQDKARLNPFALKQVVDRSLKRIDRLRRDRRQQLKKITNEHRSTFPRWRFRPAGEAAAQLPHLSFTAIAVRCVRDPPHRHATFSGAQTSN